MSWKNVRKKNKTTRLNRNIRKGKSRKRSKRPSNIGWKRRKGFRKKKKKFRERRKTDSNNRRYFTD